MATEFPIPQDFGRFVAPQAEGDNEFEDVPLGQLFDESTQDSVEVEELEDGSAIVSMEEEADAIESDFYDNLADEFPQSDLNLLALKYIEFAEKDHDDRELRDKQYEEGIRRTGMGNDAPGGASFSGASKVVHPVMAEGCVDFSARAIKELFPADGPAKTKIVGEATEEKTKKAENKRDYLNWQLTESVEEYPDELEQLLTQLPLGGSQYLKIWWDGELNRPRVEFLPIDNVYLPFSAANFYTASRMTEVNDITQDEFEQRVDRGLYRDIGVYTASQEPEQSLPAKATDKIEGKTSSQENIDGIRRLYHVYVWLRLDYDPVTKGKRAPYILMIDDLTSDVVGLYRNWEKDDPKMAKLDWIIEWRFLPWRGAYAIGLPHLIGGLAAALTGALRALLDSAHINNSPAALKLKGGKVSGQSIQLEPTSVNEIEGAAGIDDIRKIAMPLPFNPPSVVLYNLLGWLTTAAKGVVTTAEEKIADITSNAPVGTTQALIEQGAAVFSSIHARLHRSQARVFKIINRLNRWHLDEADCEMAEELGLTAEDFEKNDDIVPVSDPHIFAESQRYAQVQALASRAQAAPDLYNRLAVEKRILKQIRLPDINDVLPDPAEVKQMNPALENVAMSLGRPAGAFPGQDHFAHFQTHLDYVRDPIYGGNPSIAPALIPRMLEHLKQHLTLFYLERMGEYVNQGHSRPISVLKEEPILKEAQQLFAVASQHFAMDSKQMFSQVLPIMQGMQQMVQQLMQSQQQADPAVAALVQTQTAETARKAQYDRGRLQLDDKKIEVGADLKRMEIASSEQIKAADITHDISAMTIEKQWELQQAEQQQLRQLEQQAAQQPQLPVAPQQPQPPAAMQGV